MVEAIAVLANQFRKRISLVHKELSLAKLESHEKLPLMNQSYFSALYTSLRTGKWNHGHDEILERHRFKPDDLVCPAAMWQIMAAESIRMAAELKTHVTRHYTRFYQKWRKLCEVPDSNVEHDLDPNSTELPELLKHLWEIRRDMEDRGFRSFAIFPEASIDIRYLRFDATAIVACYKQLWKNQWADSEEGNSKKPPPNPLLLDDNGKPFKRFCDLVHKRYEEIFEELFDMKIIKKCRPKLQFRYSMQTDGVGVSLLYGKTLEVPKRRNQPKKSIPLDELKPNLAYCDIGKRLPTGESLDDFLKKNRLTFRVGDPGVHRTITTVDIGTGKDIRKTKKTLKTSAWHDRIKSEYFAKKQRRWHEENLGDVQRELNRVPYRNSSYRKLFSEYCETLFKHWNRLWDHAKMRKIRKMRHRAKMIARRELDRVTDYMTRPREGDDQTLLVCGNAARGNFFGSVKGNRKGPAKRLFDQARRRGKCLLIWADEHRSSKLCVCGHKVKYPRERRKEHLKPPPCNSQSHGLEEKWCRCFCAQSGCEEPRAIRSYCSQHAMSRKFFQRSVCYHNNDIHGHYVWNRDILGATNIACIFIGKILGLKKLGPWSRSVSANDLETSAQSWDDIFKDHGGAPFTLSDDDEQSDQNKQQHDDLELEVFPDVGQQT